jgi:glucose-6-phosphate dehydrogenase assembly protein OpcA
VEAAVTPAVQAVKPDNILHELSELWTSLARDKAQDKSAQEKAEPDHEPGEHMGTGVLRACSMTLMVFVDEEADSMTLSETLVRIMRAHPSRAIVVRLREEAGTLQSRVFAQCWLPFGQHQQICCEQVELSVSLDRLEDIPSIVAPLAAPDVPRVVWFRSSRIASAPDLGEILALGDKMIVDSARAGAPAFADLRVLANAGYIVGDLAWTRLTKLRQLIAQLLDQRDLKSIREVSIEFSTGEAGPEVRYIQAWLRTAMVSAAVNLRRVDPAGAPKRQTIRIEPDIRVRVEENCAEYEAGSLRQRGNLPATSESDLLSEELNIMTHDRTYERALQRMTAWTPRS